MRSPYWIDLQVYVGAVVGVPEVGAGVIKTQGDTGSHAKLVLSDCNVQMVWSQLYPESDGLHTCPASASAAQIMLLPTLRSGQVTVEDAAGTRQANSKIVCATGVRAIETNPGDGKL